MAVPELFIKNEILAPHTSFKTGGPADFYARPAPDSLIETARALFEKARNEECPLFILGGGTNIVVADAGFRGIVLDTGAYSGYRYEEKDAYDNLIICAGSKSDDAANWAAEHGLSGAEFLAGLPGTLGGAVWMNARCYDHAVSDILEEVELLDAAGALCTYHYNPADFDYKKSPFQNRRALILKIKLRLHKGKQGDIRQQMEKYRQDRAAKGHFSYPSAGSVFKNNRRFGAPTGKIIEELGLRGRAVGGARIADWHGNFIINTGGASAADIRALVELVQETARKERAFELEPEIIFVGF